MISFYNSLELVLFASVKQNEEDYIEGLDATDKPQEEIKFPAAKKPPVNKGPKFKKNDPHFRGGSKPPEFVGQLNGQKKNSNRQSNNQQKPAPLPKNNDKHKERGNVNPSPINQQPVPFASPPNASFGIPPSAVPSFHIPQMPAGDTKPLFDDIEPEQKQSGKFNYNPKGKFEDTKPLFDDIEPEQKQSSKFNYNPKGKFEDTKPLFDDIEPEQKQSSKFNYNPKGKFEDTKPLFDDIEPEQKQSGKFNYNPKGKFEDTKPLFDDIEPEQKQSGKFNYNPKGKFEDTKPMPKSYYDNQNNDYDIDIDIDGVQKQSPVPDFPENYVPNFPMQKGFSLPPDNQDNHIHTDEEEIGIIIFTSFITFLLFIFGVISRKVKE